MSATERRFLPPAVAVSVVAFALRPPAEAERGIGERPKMADTDPAYEAGTPTIWLPLVRRTREPFRGEWALPGGPTEWDETLSGTALRTLRAAAKREPGYLEQLYSFGGVERSAEAQRVVTIAYWALYGEHELDAQPIVEEPEGPSTPGAPDVAQPRRWDDPLPPVARAVPDTPNTAADRMADPLAQPAGENVAWFTVDRLPPLAFDHAAIIDYALSRLRAKTEYAAVTHRFLGPEFTLGRLREVTEAVLGQPVDPANFRRQALARGELVDTGKLTSGGAHRPARLYRFGDSPTGKRPESSHPIATPTNTNTNTNTNTRSIA